MELWRETLANGDLAKSWDLFIARYRRLILSVIRRTVPHDDDVSEVFAELCAYLSRENLQPLARHSDSGKARFSTWLVTVVHNRTIDWVRHRDGRRRVTAPQGLSMLQQRIFDAIICQHQSHVEAYEVIRQLPGADLTFRAFMKEVSATYVTLEKTTGKTIARFFPGPPSALEQEEPGPYDALVSSDSAVAVRAALSVLPADERLALQLFVVDELPAETVAKMVGWPNSKAVYNRVYRALAVLRRDLETSRPRRSEPGLSK